MGSFKVKLVVYFLLLSLLPIAAAFWGFTSVAGQSETRRVDARLQAGLRAVLASYQERLDGAQREAAALARRRVFQRELESATCPRSCTAAGHSSNVRSTPSTASPSGTPPPLSRDAQVAVFTAQGPHRHRDGRRPVRLDARRDAPRLGPRAPTARHPSRRSRSSRVAAVKGRSRRRRPDEDGRGRWRRSARSSRLRFPTAETSASPSSARSR